MNQPGLYEAIKWYDHVTEHPHRRRITENGDGTVELEKDQGTILQQGTPQSATNFNRMETGIMDAHLATALLLNLTRQTRWSLGKLAEDVSTMAGAGIGIKQCRLDIPAVGWEADTDGAYALHLDVPNEDISASHTPILAIDPAYIQTAIDCGLAATAQTLDGVLRVFAHSVPPEAIPGLLTLVGVNLELEPSSADTGASADTSETGDEGSESTPEGVATDADVNEMLKDIFG